MLIAKLPLTATICLQLDDPRQSRMHVPSEYTAFVREHIFVARGAEPSFAWAARLKCVLADYATLRA
jgi:hypothetical protein